MYSKKIIVSLPKEAMSYQLLRKRAWDRKLFIFYYLLTVKSKLVLSNAVWCVYSNFSINFTVISHLNWNLVWQVKLHQVKWFKALVCVCVWVILLVPQLLKATRAHFTRCIQQSFSYLARRRKPFQSQHRYTSACTAVGTEPGRHWFWSRIQ